MQEVWVSLTNWRFSSYYASSLGRIYSMKTNKILTGTKRNYIVFRLTNDNGEKVAIYLHVIIATVFCNKPHGDDLTVDHIYRDRSDNSAINLRWATKSEQARNRSTAKSYKGTQIAQYEFDGTFIRIWDKMKDAVTTLKLDRSGISRACIELKPYAGFQWRYHIEHYPDEIW